MIAPQIPPWNNRDWGKDYATYGENGAWDTQGWWYSFNFYKMQTELFFCKKTNWRIFFEKINKVTFAVKITLTDIYRTKNQVRRLGVDRNLV